MELSCRDEVLFSMALRRGGEGLVIVRVMPFFNQEDTNEMWEAEGKFSVMGLGGEMKVLCGEDAF